MAAAAASQVRATLARLPNTRESTDPMDLPGILGWYSDQLNGYPGDTRPRIIRVLRGLAERDDDVAGTLRDYLSLVNGGFAWDFVGGSRAIKAAEAELAEFAERIFPEGGGLSGLANNQTRELALAGASSLEWIPERSRRGVAGVAVVPAEEIRIRRDQQTGALIHQQVGLGEAITLNPLTYRYAAAMTSDRNPHGLPLFVSALFPLDRKRQLGDAEQRVINLMARSALITASIPTPTAAQLGCLDDQDPNYPAAQAAYFNTIADLIMASAEGGLYLAPMLGDKEVKITTVPVTQSAAGAAEVTKNNEHRVWNALGTLPFMRGEMDSTTQALAQVTIPILHAQAIHGQITLAGALEYGANLHLRLRGIPVKAQMNFVVPRSPFLLDEATALLRKAEAHTKLAALFGPAWAQAAMREFDIVDGDAARAPKWWSPTSGMPVPEPS
jgi:hypothetical protein